MPEPTLAFVSESYLLKSDRRNVGQLDRLIDKLTHADEQGKMIPSPLRVGRMLEPGAMVDCGVHHIDLARWCLGGEVVWKRGIGVWVKTFEAPKCLLAAGPRLRSTHVGRDEFFVPRDIKRASQPLSIRTDWHRSSDSIQLRRTLDGAAPSIPLLRINLGFLLEKVLFWQNYRWPRRRDVLSGVRPIWHSTARLLRESCRPIAASSVRPHRFQ